MSLFTQRRAGSEVLPESLNDVLTATELIVSKPARTVESHRSRRPVVARVPWLLVAVLVFQAVASLQLIWTNTAFEDEALYLWAGHLEWAHWLHGLPIPKFPDYFSGAPVVYPPLGALADSIGGLAGARILSLFFMLGSTSLLWATTSRLYGRRAAFFAAATWAVLGPTIRLGAFATYDAMALFLVVLAAWCATSGRAKRDATAWMMAAAGAMALANATKYATAVFDPVVICMAVLSGYPIPGRKGAWRRGAFLGCCAAFLVIALLEIGGGLYIAGLDQTTLTRPQGGAPASLVLLSSWDWIGVVIVGSIVGVASSLLGKAARHEQLMLALFAGATLLVPAEQTRIHTFTSLDKHTAFGAWFGAIALGYGADHVGAWLRPRALRFGAIAALTAGVGLIAADGISQAAAFYSWPGAGYLVPILRKISDPNYRLLADNSPPLQYYLPDTPWQQWSNVYEITVNGKRIPIRGNDEFAPFRKAISYHYFNVIVLTFTDKPQLDEMIAGYLINDKSYTFIGDVPFSNPDSKGNYMVWKYHPKPSESS